MAPKPRTKLVATKQNKRKNPTEPHELFDDPKNRFLFKDDASHKRYHNIFKLKPVSHCFHGLRPAQPEIYDQVIPYAEFWKFTKLLTVSDPVFVDLVRLFYANADFHDPSQTINSYLFGQTIKIKPADWREWFEFDNDTTAEEFYLLRKEQLLADAGFEDYLRGDSPYSSIKYYTPTQRFVYHLANNVLMPVATLKASYERKPAYLMRHMWYRSNKINIPYLIHHHMHYLSKTGSLPYGHILTWICQRLDIEIPSFIVQNSTTVPNIDLFFPDNYYKRFHIKWNVCNQEKWAQDPSFHPYHVFPELDSDGKPIWPTPCYTKRPFVTAPSFPHDQNMDNQEEDAEEEYREPNPEANPTENPNDDDVVGDDYSGGTFEQASRAFFRRSTQTQAIQSQHISDIQTRLSNLEVYVHSNLPSHTSPHQHQNPNPVSTSANPNPDAYDPFFRQDNFFH